MTGRRLLLVEDDPTLNEAISRRLETEGYEVTRAYDGPGAVALADSGQPEAVILDVMLPGFDGLEVCRQIQSRRPVPVLMLTARDDESDILAGLAVGADDYVTKPFGMKELVARVAALLRRVDRARVLAARPPAQHQVGSMQVDVGARRVRVGGDPVHLTPTEFDLLATLAARAGHVLTRAQLLAEVWDWPDASGTRTVDSHIKSLRAKLGTGWIRTVHGVGYSLEQQ